jgi:amino acid permease
MLIAKELKIFFAQTAVVVATTVGAGMFALPYVFSVSGWLPGVFYLVAFTIILSFVHAVYFLVLRRVKERKRLAALVSEALGPARGVLAFIAVVGGQLLSLLVYLILGETFLRLFLPELGGAGGVALFWVIASLPLFLGLRRFAWAEGVGALAMGGLIVAFLASSDIGGGLARIPVLDEAHLLFPFGVILFSLAGWTAVEPVYELNGRVGERSTRQSLVALAVGTGISAILYVLFVLGALGSPVPITEDTVSGFSAPLWRALLGILGLFAIWTSYVPVGREAAHTLMDKGWKESIALAFVTLAPLALFAAGFSDFVRMAGFAGGVFLALEYLCIVAVGQWFLRPQGTTKALFWILYVILLAAVVYELFYFLAG